MKTCTRYMIFVLPVWLGLSGCSTYVENQASQEFKPIFKTELVSETSAPPTGGIYKDGKGGLFAIDRRARRVGDILTVELNEAFNALKSQAATSAKSDSFDVTLPWYPQCYYWRFRGRPADKRYQPTFNGTGGASQSNSITGLLSVTVVDVMDNGNMEILGQKKLNLNNGDEYIRISGIVRPEIFPPAI